MGAHGLSTHPLCTPHILYVDVTWLWSLGLENDSDPPEALPGLPHEPLESCPVLNLSVH